MELYVVLDEWCDAAEATNRFAWETLEGNRPDVTRRSWLNPFARVGFTEITPVNNHAHGYVDRREAEIQALLESKAQWAKRWQGSHRRQAARRSLRNMMKLYCPEVLGSFEAAITSRSAWIREHRKSLPLTLSNPDTPIEAVEELATELERTVDALRDARQQLRDLLRETFPLGARPEQA
ncbi:hypothetical protein ABZ924_32675 [Streptomyces sp. NPDC046876]|uniref:hypothetical protein n=1 Tax=Streptomyces sp. NPDC046876 TaxID=3155616 RepID=UPI0034047F31